jgi:hypothetical protein
MAMDLKMSPMIRMMTHQHALTDPKKVVRCSGRRNFTPSCCMQMDDKAPTGAVILCSGFTG